jgi:hypothetical protein
MRGTPLASERKEGCLAVSLEQIIGIPAKGLGDSAHRASDAFSVE